MLIKILPKIRWRKPQMVIWECDSCQKHFELLARRSKGASTHFCSMDCRKQYSRTEDSKRVTNWVKQNGGPRFVGGFGITTDGYVWIKIAGSAHHDQIKLHRYLMEVKLGRKLLPKEIVHHKNFNKFDNRIENLEIVTRVEHNQIHKLFNKGVV